MGKQNCRQTCPHGARAYQPEGHTRRQSPETIGSTPGIQGIDPRCTETGPPMNKATRPLRYTGSRPPMYGDWTPDEQGHKTQHPPDEDQGLRGHEDSEGSRTSWDSGLRGIQDFTGPGTSWDSGLRRTRDFVGSRPPQETGLLHTSDWNLVLWCSLREHKLSG